MMSTVGMVVRTLISRFLLLLLSVAYAPFILLALVLPQVWVLDSRFYFWLAQFFYWFTRKISLLSISVQGAEHIPSDPAIFVANHQSSFDIPLLGSLVGAHPHIWFALKDLLQSPILRFLLPPFSVFVDNSSPMSGMRSLLQIIRILNNRMHHCMIFPEGGRFTDGSVHDFYSGFAILAKKLGRPVVPVYLHNLNKVYPPDVFWIRNYPIKVVIGRPFIMQENETDKEFKDRVYAWFCEQAEKNSKQT